MVAGEAPGLPGPPGHPAAGGSGPAEPAAAGPLCALPGPTHPYALPAPMGRPPYAILALLWAPFFVACLGPPKAQDLLAVSLRSPEDTFRTFQTALRGDLPDLEYRTLGEGFKERNGGVTQITYREFRDQLFGRSPWLRYAAKACITSSERLSPDRHRIEALVDTWIVDKRFAVTLVLESGYDVYDEEGLLEGEHERWAALAREEGGSLVLEVPMPQGTTLDELAEIRAVRAWKIDSFELLDEDDSPAP